MKGNRSTARIATRAGLLAGIAVVVMTGVSMLAGAWGNSQSARARQPTKPRDSVRISIPRPVKPAFMPHNPHPLSEKRTLSRWAPVRSEVAAHARPSRSSRVVARVTTSTPEGTANIASVLGDKQDSDGRLWVHIALAVLPNGTTGWVPRKALGGYGFVATRLVINLKTFKATLFRGHRAIFTAAVGVGKPASPTPKGRFYIRDMVRDYRDAFYGPLAFGTSARSSSLTDWPSGGFIGIHGTNRPALIPGAISHGCIRMRNGDISRLAKLMPVGTPVVIR